MAYTANKEDKDRIFCNEKCSLVVVVVDRLGRAQEEGGGLQYRDLMSLDLLLPNLSLFRAIKTGRKES
jgi:hypothetical protein